MDFNSLSSFMDPDKSNTNRISRGLYVAVE
jgi:hypothetical protein